MVDWTAGVLRSRAGTVLKDVSLEQVFLASCQMQTQDAPNNGTLRVAYGTQTGAERSATGTIRVRVKYAVFALGADDDLPLPDDAGELTTEQIDERFVWRIDAEWVAQFVGDAAAVTDHQDEDITAFSVIMGPPTVHPFARELVQSLTGKGEHPAFTLGLMTPVSALPDDEVIELDDAE